MTPPILFIPGFMQPGDAWAPSWPSGSTPPTALLDHREHSFEGRLAEIAAGGARARCWSATRSAAGWRCAPRCATRRATRALVTVGATAGIEDAQPSGRHAPRPTSGSPSWIEAAPIEDVVAIWERQPLFADQSEALVEAQRAGRLAQDPRELALPAAHAPARACSSRSGTSCSRSSCPCWRSPAAATRATPSAARQDRRHRARTRKARIVADAGPRRRTCSSPTRWSPTHLPISLDERTSTSERLRAPRRPARARRHLQRPVARRRQRARERRVEQLQRRQPAGQLQVLGGGQLQRGGDAPGPVERARQERAEPLRARQPQRLAGGAEAARAGQLHVDDVAGLSLDRARAPRAPSRPTRPPRSGWTRGRAPGAAPRGCGRAARRTRGRSCSSARMLRDRLVDRPGAVGVDPQRGPGADRLAHRRDALLVVGQADLHLEARVAGAHALARRARPPPPAVRRGG